MNLRGTLNAFKSYPSHFTSTNCLARKQPFGMLRSIGEESRAEIGRQLRREIFEYNHHVREGGHLDFLTRGADSHTSSNSPSATRIKLSVTIARKMPILSWKCCHTALKHNHGSSSLTLDNLDIVFLL
jgi:hypothetical protein